MPLKLPLILGHRGNRKEHGYENTLEAMEFASQNADGFETDIVLSKDGEICVIHDTFYTGHEAHYELNIRLDEASKKLTSNRRIDEMDRKEINSLRLINGATIPDLPDLKHLIRQHPDKIANIELKVPNSGCKIIKQIPDMDNYFISSFNHSELLRVRESCPKTKLGALFEPSNTAGCKMYPWDQNCTDDYIPFSPDAVRSDILRQINPNYFHINEYDLRPEIVRDIVTLYPNSKIVIWWYFPEPPPERNTNLIHKLHHLHREGLWESLHAIISDYPAAMKKMIEKQFGGEK
ncbi:MAG TPA: glycerophosphodiester phosphodiesterase family protein [Alphaproteobacteria bacterium]|nr:glycerophosphodiester phosphodiesterase family protein [Alphaproteobacteria bacterium]HNS44730.1 glycerophosphodiester phosphodiesterase family protein [Alphaproteobacteria bacterium]